MSTPEIRRARRSIIVAGFGQNLVLTTVTTFILVYLLEHARISTQGMAVVTAVITVTKIVDAVCDPIVGGIIDLTRTRWGKMRPYILFSAGPVAVLSTLMFLVPDVDEPAQLVYFAVVYFLWGLAYTLCDVPFWGLIGSAFSDAPMRTRVIGDVRAFGAIALGLATLGMPWLALLLSFPSPSSPGSTGTGWSLAVALVAVIGMSMFLRAFFGTRERQSTAATARVGVGALVRTLGRNTPLLMVLLGSVLGFGRFIVQAGGAVFVVIAYDDEGAFTLIGAAIIGGMVLASFGAPALMRRIGGRAAVIGSSVVGAALYVAMYLVGWENLAALLVFVFLTGLMLGVFLVAQATLIADAVDDVELRTGIRNDGLSFSTLTFVSKIMTALALLVFGMFVVLAGYQADVPVTPQMQQTVFVAITLVPAVSCLLSAVPFVFYRLTGRGGAGRTPGVASTASEGVAS